MKKFLLLILFLITYGVNAQSFWTIADGVPTLPANKTPFLPVWGEEMDNNQHNQLLYYDAMLTPIVGGKITKLTFYSTTENENWGGATGTVKLMQTTATSISFGGINSAGATEVYTGAVAIENGTMTFTFSTPFTYLGENLLIDITTISAGTWKNTEFNGLPTTIFLGCRNGQPICFFTKVTFEYYPQSSSTYTITASATEGGAISPCGIITVGENENKRFDFIPDENFILSKVWIDGATNQTALTNSYYIFNNITANHIIHAEFSPVTGNSYTITASTSTGGQITPKGNVTVLENEDKKFEFSADYNYVLSKVLVDNIENEQAFIDGYYIFTNVTANHSIYAEFEATGGTLTVANDTKVGATIPVSTSYMDCSQHVQIIYLAEFIQGLTDKSIKKITYHTSTAYETFGGATGTIKIMQTTATNLSSGFLNTDNATVVYSGPIAIANLLMEFEFLVPFVYTGENLLIDITTNPGEPRNIIFYGATSSELSRFNFTFEGITYNQTNPFTPKTTFEYTNSMPPPPTHTITATASAGGTITPSGNIPVPENQNKRFDFTSNENYELSKILIDNVENAQALIDGYYIFTNVTSNHAIHAEFVLINTALKNSLQDMLVYTANNMLYIINENNIPLKTVEIIDMMGRNVYHSTMVSNSIQLNVTKGIYIVRLVSEYSVLNTKVVIK